MVEVFDSACLPATIPFSPPEAATPSGPAAVHRAQMAHLAQSIARDLPPVDCPVLNHFSPGVYARELRIPAGTIVVGAIHKFENMLLMIQGVCEIRGDGEPRTVRAPQIWVSAPGTQRSVLAITDCVFVSVHGTDKRDVNEIRAEFIAENALEYEQFLLEHKQ